MSEYPKVSDELIKAILNEEVEEEVFSAQKNVTVARIALESGTVPGGYIGVIMGFACNFDASTTYYLKVAEKDRYANGLTAAGLSDIAVGAGVGDEVALLETLDENVKWELGATRVAGAAVQNYRLRIRYYKKESALVG